MAAETETQNRTDLRVINPVDVNSPREATALLEHAHRVAEDTMTTARAEAERLLMAARHDAQQLRKQAREQADREVSDATRKAEVTRAQAQEEADRLMTDARSAVSDIERDKEQLCAARDAAAASARDFASQLLELADRQASHPSD